MALKIGALILASCQFLNASVIDLRGYNRHQEGSNCESGSRGHHYHHASIKGYKEPLPTPGVIIKDFTIGGQTSSSGLQKHASDSSSSNIYSARKSRQEHSSHSSDSKGHHIPQVTFGSLNTVQLAPKPQKAPITIVNTATVSKAAQTRHEVSSNYATNQSNLPEHKDTDNYSAKKELLQHDNLLSTRVGPVKRVEIARREKESDSTSEHSSPAKYHAHKVQQSKLEQKVEKQLAIGDVIENAPLVVRNYQVAKTEQRPSSHSSKDKKKLALLVPTVPTKVVLVQSGTRIQDDSSSDHKGGYVHKSQDSSSSDGPTIVHSPSYLVAKNLIVSQPTYH